MYQNQNNSWGGQQIPPGMVTQQPNWNQPAQSQIQPQQPTPMVRFINSLADLGPGDIPQIGTRSIFLQMDGSCVYVKLWDDKCNLHTFKYDNAGEVNPEPADPMAAIIERLDKLEKEIKNQNKKKNFYPSTKKQTEKENQE